MKLNSHNSLESYEGTLTTTWRPGYRGKRYRPRRRTTALVLDKWLSLGGLAVNAEPVDSWVRGFNE